MASLLAFVIGLFAGMITVLFGIALVAVDEREEIYRTGYADGLASTREGGLNGHYDS